MDHLISRVPGIPYLYYWVSVEGQKFCELTSCSQNFLSQKIVAENKTAKVTFLKYVVYTKLCGKK